MIAINPEFHRNLWLKFSPFRLAAMPLLVGTILAIAMTQEKIWSDAIFEIALYGYMMVVFIWGNYEAAGAVRSEDKNNTWDFQRMSSIGPWELSLGKLFGATSYVWYFGLTLLSIVTVCYIFGSNDAPLTPLPLLLAYLVMAGIMGHATALLASLEALKNNKSGFIFPFLLGMMVSQMVISTTNVVSSDKDSLFKAGFAWFGQPLDPQIFTIASLLFFFFWIIVGLQRKMREELQFRNSPVAFMVFSATMTTYLIGMIRHGRFESSDYLIAFHAFVAFFFLSFLTYIAVIAEAGKFSKYKRFLLFLRTRNVKRAWEDTPMWIPTALMVVVAYVTINIYGNALNRNMATLNTLSMSTAFILFMVRDGLVLHTVLLGERLKHAKFVLVFYYVMVYALLPMLVSVILKDTYRSNPGWLSNASFLAAKQQLSYIFFPVGTGGFWISIIPPLIQSLMAGLALKISLRRLESSEK